MTDHPPLAISAPAQLARLVAESRATAPLQPDAPPPRARGLSKGALLTLLGGNAADAASTLYALSRPGVHEANPIYGAHPSAARLLGIKAGTTALQWAVLQLLAKRDHRTLANGLAYGSGAALGGVAANNLRLAAK